MAANQRKKRINASSLIACTSHEQYKVNRKRLQVQHHNLNMRPNINLEWDKNKRSVVSKRDQIGITHRHMVPFIGASPHCPHMLADVVSVPQEIFELEDLREVLSYEVWQSCLSDKERKFLCQFLPKDPEPDTILRDLLAGDNFHFGNPFLKWGASLCMGMLHPDNVDSEEQHLKSVKKSYYSHLQKYHNDMIETLQMWKNKWVNCKDPGVDIVQNVWSSRKHTGQNMPTSETGSYGTEEQLVATPESSSWINSEVACSSDNQNSGMKHEESQRRKDSLKKMCGYSNELKGTAVPRMGEKMHKRNIQNADGAKYMSYIKVSKEQHERVKSCMKHAGNSIQPKSLNSVLGSIDALNVQPFEKFEEEERKKLHHHWLRLATKDIPEAFVNWQKRQFQRQEVIRSLGVELGQKPGHQLVSLDGEGHDSQNNKRMQLLDDIDREILPSVTIEGVEKELTDDLLQEQSDNDEAIHEMSTDIKDEKDIEKDNIFEQQIRHHTRTTQDDNVSGHVLIQDHNEKQITSLNSNTRSTMAASPNPSLLQDQHQRQHQQSISSLNFNPHSHSMKMESDCGNNACAKTNEDPPILSQHTATLNHVDIPVNPGGLLSSTCDVWPISDVRSSYYQSTAANAGYLSSQELAIEHPQYIQGQEARVLDLENDSQGEDPGNEMLPRQPEDISFFSSYSNQDRNELLHSFFKGHSNMSYHQQQKHSGLEFQPGNDLVLESGHFSELREQVHPSLQLDPRQKRMHDLYMNQNIPEAIYSGSQFTAVPRQEELPVNNIHDWASVNKACMAVPSQPHVSSGALSQNWCAGESGSRDGWPSFEIAVGVGHNLGSGRNSDQTLFSVISECNELQQQSGYESVAPTELLMAAGNYSGGIGGGIPLSSNFLQQSPPNRLNYLSGGHDPNAGIKMNNLGWMGMPQQNSGIQGSMGMGKPFLRSWNHHHQQG